MTVPIIVQWKIQMWNLMSRRGSKCLYVRQPKKVRRSKIKLVFNLDRFLSLFVNWFIYSIWVEAITNGRNKKCLLEMTPFLPSYNFHSQRFHFYSFYSRLHRGVGLLRQICPSIRFLALPSSTLSLWNKAFNHYSTPCTLFTSQSNSTEIQMLRNFLLIPLLVIGIAAEPILRPNLYFGTRSAREQSHLVCITMLL